MQHEFGSIIRIAESTFGLGSLGAVDERADDLGDCFDYARSAQLFVPFASQLRARLHAASARLHNLLIPLKWTLALCAFVGALVPAVAGADVTHAIGGGPALGSYSDIGDSTTLAGRPVPLVRLEARFGSLEFRSYSVPLSAYHLLRRSVRSVDRCYFHVRRDARRV